MYMDFVKMLNTRILLVVDNSKEAHEISKDLKSWGFKSPIISSSIVESFDMEYDVIIMDSSLKNKFKNMKKGINGKPTIFIEKNPSKHRDQSYFKENFTILPTPFTNEELRTAIEVAVYKFNFLKKFKGSKKFSNEVINAFSDSIFVIDDKGIILDANEAAANRLKLKKVEIIGKNLVNFTPTNIRDSRIIYFKKAVQTGEVVEFEDEREGIYLHHRMFPMKEGNITDRIIVSSQDVTESKYIEKSLLSLNRYNRSLIEASIDPLVTIGVDGKINDINRAVELITGYSRDEIVGTDFSDYFTSPDEAKRGYMKVFADGFVRNYPLEIRHKNGDVTPVLYNASVYHDENEQVMGVFAAARDITQLIEAENKLKESEEKYRSFIETAQEGVWLLDENGITKYVNREMENILGYRKEEMVGNSFLNFVDEESKTKAKKLMEKRKLGIKERYDFRFLNKFGSNVWVMISTNPLFNKEHEYMGALKMLTDITERKEMEVELKKSLSEKEMLLKEIHHRVKNNLMVISSLLNLQSNYIKDKDDFEMFKESQARAKSMALIHELLYQSDDLKRIDFGNFITKLANDLYNTYVQDTGNVKMKLNLKKTMLDINTSIPLGLIVNELVSNCMKHAFPDDRQGEIDVGLKSKNGKYTLMVADNGIGLPKDIDFKNTDSLGLQLVNSLTNQIEGDLVLNTDNGSEFKVIFKEIL